MKPLCFIAALVTACFAAPVSAEILRGVVVGVLDGDTITLLTPEKRSVRIRLAEIDAPELRGQPFGSPPPARCVSIPRRGVATRAPDVQSIGLAEM